MTYRKYPSLFRSGFVTPPRAFQQPLQRHADVNGYEFQADTVEILQAIAQLCRSHGKLLCARCPWLLLCPVDQCSTFRLFPPLWW
jgi:hypothetical protein